MDPHTAQQKFQYAKARFLEGFYEEALLLLNELAAFHPGVFNLDYPRLLCLKRLERLEETKELYAGMCQAYPHPNQQQKMEEVGAWIAAQENSGLGTLGSLDIGLDDILGGGGAADDLLGLSPASPKNEPKTAARGEEHHSHHKAIIAAVAGVIVIIAAIIYLPGILRPTPQFSAEIIVGLPYGTLEGKIFRKKNDIVRLEMMGQILIYNEDRVYVLIPEEQIYSEMSLGDLVGKSMISELNDFEAWIDRQGVRKVNEEVLYGLKCEVYQGKLSTNPSMSLAETKVWWSPVLAFPVKSERLSTGLLSRMVMFMRNLRVETLPDELFLPPEHYKHVSPEVTQDLGANMGLGVGPGMVSGNSASPPMPSPPSAPPDGGAGASPPGTDDIPNNSGNMDPQAMQQLMQQMQNRP